MIFFSYFTKEVVRYLFFEIEGKKAETTLTNELIITLESFGQLEVKDIFKKSIDVLKKDLNEILKRVNK